MVIAELCNYAADYSGNFMASLKSMERYAKADGSQTKVIYILPQSARGKEWVNILHKQNEVLFLPAGRVLGRFELVKWCMQKHIDVLHVHFYGVTTFFMVGWFCKTKVVQHFHNTFDRSSKLKTLFVRALSLCVDRFVGCSETVRDSLISSGFQSRKCLFITNRIDFSRLNLSKDNRPFDINKRNLLILGTDFYRKGVDVALQSIKPITNQDEIVLHIITHTPQETQKSVEEVLGDIPQWVQFLQPTEYIGDYYRACDIFLSPSREEGFCYAIHEALYCGCMALKSDLPAMNYGLQNEEMITVNENWQQRIEQVLHSDKKELACIVDDLKSQVIKKYNVDKWGEEVFALYKEVLR